MHDKMGWVYPVKEDGRGVVLEKGPRLALDRFGPLSKVVRRLVQELGLFLRGVGRQKALLSIRRRPMDHFGGEMKEKLFIR